MATPIPIKKSGKGIIPKIKPSLEELSDFYFDSELTLKDKPERSRPGGSF